MLAEERFGLILGLLAEKRTATVQELCETLNASESTIRRDLNELARLGKLNKVHGGATLPDSQFLADEPSMSAKETLAVAQKQSIAKAAVDRARETWFLVDDSKFARVYPAVISDLKGGAILTNHCPNPQYRQFTLVKETEA